MGGKRQTWSAQEQRTVLELHEAGVSFEQIGQRFGRTKGAIKTFIARSSWTEAQRVRESLRERNERKPGVGSEPFVIPAFVIVDWHNRLSIVPTLENILIGTPLKGYGADAGWQPRFEWQL